MKKNATIVIVDDHVLLRRGLCTMVTELGYDVLYDCNNGQELIEKIDEQPLPDLILLDTNMPRMDGFQTALWLKNYSPSVKVLVLTFDDDENSMLQMFRNGVRGYILKDTYPDELKQAIDTIISTGFYYYDPISGQLICSAHDEEEDYKKTLLAGLNEKQIKLLQLMATDTSDKEIAKRMELNQRTFDKCIKELFEKLNVKTRVGLVLFAIKSGIVHFN